MSSDFIFKAVLVHPNLRFFAFANLARSSKVGIRSDRRR